MATATVEIFDKNAISVMYPGDDMISTFSALAANKISALKDGLGNNQELVLGATSNINVEAQNTINLYAGDQGTISLQMIPSIYV